jgi:hypothetical protein
MLRRLLLPTLALCLAAPGIAADGVLELNQACATTTGCFTGDTPGFPVSVSVPGSYALTSNLAAGAAPTAINVTSANVHLDLGGFEVSGDCTAPSGRLVSSTAAYTTVRNGTVRGGCGFNVGTADGAVVEDLLVADGKNVGISIGNGGIVRRCVVRGNGTVGILTGEAAVISGNSVTSNGTDGIRTGNGSTIDGNTVRSNNLGIFAAPGSTVRANAISNNAQVGIQGTSGNAISDNAIYENENVGILVTGAFGAYLHRNTFMQNTNAGLRVESGAPDRPTTYRENVFHGNGATVVLGTFGFALDLGGNACNGATACP